MTSIRFYMVHNANEGLVEENEAFDFCMMQKILPRITGGDSRVEMLLNDLYEWITGESYDAEDIAFTNYPRSAKKVAEMLGEVSLGWFHLFLDLLKTKNW